MSVFFKTEQRHCNQKPVHVVCLLALVKYWLLVARVLHSIEKHVDDSSSADTCHFVGVSPYAARPRRDANLSEPSTKFENLTDKMRIRSR